MGDMYAKLYKGVRLNFPQVVNRRHIENIL